MPTTSSATSRALLRAWVLTALADGLFALVMGLILYGNLTRIWQGVASVLLGRAAMGGGVRTALIGVAMHIGVAFWWSAVFAFGLSRIGAIARALRTSGGSMAVAAIYGPLIWIAMSFAVIPSFTHRLPAITWVWWVELVGHFPFVGIPIVFPCRHARARSIAAIF